MREPGYVIGTEPITWLVFLSSGLVSLLVTLLLCGIAAKAWGNLPTRFQEAVRKTLWPAGGVPTWKSDPQSRAARRRARVIRISTVTVIYIILLGAVWTVGAFSVSPVLRSILVTPVSSSSVELCRWLVVHYEDYLDSPDDLKDIHSAMFAQEQRASLPPLLSGYTTAGIGITFLDNEVRASDRFLARASTGAWNVVDSRGRYVSQADPERVVIWKDHTGFHINQASYAGGVFCNSFMYDDDAVWIGDASEAMAAQFNSQYAKSLVDDIALGKFEVCETDGVCFEAERIYPETPRVIVEVTPVPRDDSTPSR